MKKFVIQLLINAVAFFAAITILRGHGIEAQGIIWVDSLVLGLIFCIINAVLRPIMMGLGCPVIILTLGLGIYPADQYPAVLPDRPDRQKLWGGLYCRWLCPGVPGRADCQRGWCGIERGSEQ